MEHISLAWPIGLTILGLLCFGFAAVSNPKPSGPKITYSQPSSGFNAVMLGILAIIAAVYFIWLNGAGAPISGDDPRIKVANLAVGHTYETMWQSEDGKHTLLKKEDGQVLYYTFSAPVPTKLTVSYMKKLVPVEK